MNDGLTVMFLRESHAVSNLALTDFSSISRVGAYVATSIEYRYCTVYR